MGRSEGRKEFLSVYFFRVVFQQEIFMQQRSQGFPCFSIPHLNNDKTALKSKYF